MFPGTLSGLHIEDFDIWLPFPISLRVWGTVGMETKILSRQGPAAWVTKGKADSDTPLPRLYWGTGGLRSLPSLLGPGGQNEATSGFYTEQRHSWFPCQLSKLVYTSGCPHLATFYLLPAQTCRGESGRSLSPKLWLHPNSSLTSGLHGRTWISNRPKSWGFRQDI